MAERSSKQLAFRDAIVESKGAERRFPCGASSMIQRIRIGQKFGIGPLTALWTDESYHDTCKIIGLSRHNGFLRLIAVRSEQDTLAVRPR